MGPDGSVILEWSGQHRVFRLAWGEFFRLQELADCGPYHLAARILSNKWRVADVWAVIFYGLIGGGANASEAAAVIKEAETAPPFEALALARTVINAALYSPDDDAIDFPGQKSDPEPSRNGKVRASNMYGNGAVLGLSPEQIDRSSVWQLAAAMAGFQRAHSPNDKSLSSNEMDDLWAGVQDRMN